ncbi:hypothetical protein HZB02_03850 [Candidatus Woesearchaeota archaeon]|nr:hypothetical protein [Candidatus Woesearchaeota archaeon]
MKKLGIGLMMVVMSILLASLATALPYVDYVKINGDVHQNGDDLIVKRGEVLNIHVRLLAQSVDSQAGVNTTYCPSSGCKDVEVESKIFGYEYNDYRDEELVDNVQPFNMGGSDVKYVDLKVTVPNDITTGQAKLRVMVGDRNSDTVQTYNFQLRIEGESHSIRINDVNFHDSTPVKAGGILISSVRIENIGGNDENGIKVIVSIPTLGVSNSYYMDNLDTNDEADTEDIWLRVPREATPGNYDVEVEVQYDRYHEKVYATRTIKVVAADSLVNQPAIQQPPQKGPENIISVEGVMKEVTAGQGGAIYPITLTNAGTSAKTYTISVTPLDWATVTFSPGNVVLLNTGETKTVYVYVAALPNAAVGAHTFMATVTVGSESKQLTMATLVKEAPAPPPTNTGSWTSLKTGLQIGLAVLVIVLIIVGIVVGINRSKKQDNEEGKDNSESETYY